MNKGAPRRGFFRSSLPPKTLVGFIAAILAVVVISYLSYRSLQNRSAGAERVAQTIETIERLDLILSTVRDAESGQRGFILTEAERYLQPYDMAMATLPRTLSQARSAVSDDPEQVQRLDAVEQLATDKLAELKQTIADVRAGRRDAALQVVMTDRGREAMDRIRTLVGEMDKREHAELEARTREWEQAVSLSAIVTWAGSALLLFLICAAAFMSAKDFHEQEVQAWLRTGQNELGARMQGQPNMLMLGDNIASFLAEYLGAQVSAVYFEDAGANLRRVGGYALSSDAAPDEKADPGGLTAQVLKDKSLVSLTAVPFDYFPISSGLGKSQPRHLVIAPATADGVPNAVVELGFFHPVVPAELELLRRVAESIGIALRTVQYRKDLENLLEETQRQAEELQTQQEELRVNNEELEQQSRSLQESQERLRNQQAELEQINSQLEEQTQALGRQRDDLLRAQSEVQRASAYKSEFLANMSHELRTPLNSSLILAKLLVDNREGNLNAEQVKFAQTIYSAGNDLLTLINDILDLSKIEAGKMDVRAERVTLRRMIDELTDTFQPIAHEKQLELTTTFDPDAPDSIDTDPIRLQQILKNLLSNALKFTQQGGVSLHVRREFHGRIAFDVKDTGIGIPAEQQQVVFEAFRQADGTTNRKYGGTGLGLSISRDLAKLLGGELRLESAPGRGSTFTLILPEQYVEVNREREPVRIAPLPARRPAPAVASIPAKPAPPAAAAAPDDREKLTADSRVILVIEDDEDFADIIRNMARELEFQTIFATTAEEGLALAEKFRPSGIVLDVGLPDRSGLSVLDSLKHSASTRHIPVHMMSVSDYTHTALEMGAAGYALKPVKREELVQALKRLESKFTQKVRRLLVVEDDDVHRESTCRLLSGNDIEITAVGTAAEALDRLQKTTFDCMVLDLSLPDRTGFELLEEMSRQDRAAFPPVIVYTGRSLSRDEEQRLRRYSQSIIIKGARSPERLLDEVTLFLHQVEADLPPDRQRMLRDARHREAIFEGRRILVVEDDVRNIFALSSVLEPKGAKIEIARNGREALSHLKDNPGVDLVLMDIMMPEMDGLSATREIRKRPELARLPIIALTAKAMLDDRENCLAAGANDYIAKPLDVDKLLSLARVWMPK